MEIEGSELKVRIRLEQKQNKEMEIENTRKYLKEKLQKDTTTFLGHEKERNHIRDLFWRTATESESNSALLIGPKKGGKTTVRKIRRIRYSIDRKVFFAAEY